MFQQHGALRLVETWGDATPDSDPGNIRGPIQAGNNETVVFSWIEWPDRATADATWAKMMSDDQAEDDSVIDWDRMTWGGFEQLFDSTQDA